MTHTKSTNHMVSEILIDCSFLGVNDDFQRPFVMAFPAKSPRSDWTTLEWFSAAEQVKDLVYYMLWFGCIGRTISGRLVADFAFLLSVEEITVEVFLTAYAASPIGACRAVDTEWRSRRQKHNIRQHLGSEDQFKGNLPTFALSVLPCLQYSIRFWFLAWLCLIRFLIKKIRFDCQF